MTEGVGSARDYRLLLILRRVNFLWFLFLLLQSLMNSLLSGDTTTSWQKVFLGVAMAMNEPWVSYSLRTTAHMKLFGLQLARFFSFRVCNTMNGSGALTCMGRMWELGCPFWGHTWFQKAALLGKPRPCCSWPPGHVSHQGETEGSNDYTVHTGESIIVPKGNKQRSIETGFVFVRLYSIQSFYDYIYSSVYLCNKLPL